MGTQVAVLICGRLDDDRFPGRNTFPLLGRPMMVYPILAAQHAQRVHRVFLSTDARSIALLAQHQGVQVIERPPELQGNHVALEGILAHSYRAIQKELKEELVALVILLCNAPTVTGGLIDHGVEILLNDPTLDAVMSVSRHNEFHPSFALRLAEGGYLASYSGTDERTADHGDAYFPDALLWVLRPQRLSEDALEFVSPNCIVNCAAQRVYPLIHEGYGDVDYAWQVPAAEEWLRRQGFSEEATPYDQHDAEQRSEEPRWVESVALQRRPATSKRVLITTIPFGELDRRPLELLEEAGVEFVMNPIGRKLKEEELAEMVDGFDALIAGTEPITGKVLERATRLRLISRVGIGLDSVDLMAARQRGILVAYTPDAPAPAVAELTLGLMLGALRFISHADRSIRNGVWYRQMGERLSRKTVGVMGVGRVGTRVIQHLSGFGSRIVANDLRPDMKFGAEHGVQWVDKRTLYREADLITLHLPLTRQTRELITVREIEQMKPGTILINTSRGGVISETDLADALRTRRLAAAALDVFQHEPYAGPLITVDNCILTCHMGSMAKDCRTRMELEATEEVIRFLNNRPLRQLVPEEEYQMTGF